jgi:hypothetical protein
MIVKIPKGYLSPVTAVTNNDRCMIYTGPRVGLISPYSTKMLPMKHLEAGQIVFVCKMSSESLMYNLEDGVDVHVFPVFGECTCFEC